MAPPDPVAPNPEQPEDARPERASGIGFRHALTTLPESEGEPDEAFEKRMIREILISERLRVQLLVAIPSVTLLLFLALTSSYSEAADLAFHNRFDRLRVGLILGGFAAYELLSLRNVERQIKGDKQLMVLRRYINALVETSLPTLAIIYYISISGPAAALLLPPSFVYFVFILLSTLRLDFWLCFFTGVVAAVEYGGLALLVLDPSASQALDPVLTSIPHHIAKACILLASGVAAGFVAQRLRRGFVKTLRSLEERSRIVSVFGQHVSPAVVDRLLAEKAGIRSEVREVCVMFLDIRNFTAFSENRSPEQVVGHLNLLFGFMIESVNNHQGIVNKFLGDGFMAVFGAPLSDGDDCRHAVDAGLEIIARLEERCRKGSLPPTRIGIGLHTGKAVIGNVGSMMRKEYTVIGDVVNVASRVEALNKEFDSQLLVTAQVWEASGKPMEAAIERPPIAIRGRKEPIQLYQLA
jgi:adenylate cyclase